MERRREYYKGEGGGFPQVRAMVNFMSPKLYVVHPNTKNVKTMQQPTCCLVCADPNE
jgi:hypothetical protein